jgi:hypothetical protein
MASLCQYKDILGEPYKGVHSVRLFNVAIIDVILSILMSYYLSNHFKYDFYTVLLLVLLAGIVLHRLFCVNTTINKLIFGEITNYLN